MIALAAYLAFVGALAFAARQLETGGNAQAELGLACATLDYAASMSGSVSFELPENNFTARNGALYLGGESRECLHSVAVRDGLVVSSG